MAHFSLDILIDSKLSSLPDTVKFPKTETFPRLVKYSKEARWCSPNSLPRFSASDLASLRLSLELQTPSNVTRLIGLQLKKWRAFCLDFAMFQRITHLMMLTVAASLSAFHGSSPLQRNKVMSGTSNRLYSASSVLVLQMFAPIYIF